MAVQLSRVQLPVGPALREAIDQFDCVGDRHPDDPVAERVKAFLREAGFEHGIQHGYSSTYVLVDDEEAHRTTGTPSA